MTSRQTRRRAQRYTGGVAAVGTTDFRESPLGLFAVPPACFMHHQASFIPSFFPEGTVLGEDANFFYGHGVLVHGTIADGFEPAEMHG